MNDKVLSIEQMQHLQELGIDTSNASMFYVPKLDPKGEYCLLNVQPNPVIPYIPTYTLHDIIGMLPKEIVYNEDCYALTMCIYADMWHVCYSMSDEFDYYKEFESESLLDAAYEMLCWCAEKGYLKSNVK